MNSIAQRGTALRTGSAEWERRILWLSLALALMPPILVRAQTYRVLKNFSGSDGGWPSAGLVVAGSTLYGTTWWGGNPGVPSEMGLRVVFKVNTDGSGYAVLERRSLVAVRIIRPTIMVMASSSR
jgi:hypothetical protein